MSPFSSLHEHVFTYHIVDRGVSPNAGKMNEIISNGKRIKLEKERHGGNKLALLTKKFEILLERIHLIWHARACTSFFILFQSGSHFLLLYLNWLNSSERNSMLISDEKKKILTEKEKKLLSSDWLVNKSTTTTTVY